MDVRRYSIGGLEVTEQPYVWLVLFMPTTPQEPLAIIGVFDHPDKARNACTTVQHVFGPVRLNVDYNKTHNEWWPGADYPLAPKHLREEAWK